MARGAGGGIPGNSLGQDFTSSSTLTHLLGVSGAPTGTVGGAAVGRGVDLAIVGGLWVR